MRNCPSAEPPPFGPREIGERGDRELGGDEDCERHTGGVGEAVGVSAHAEHVCAEITPAREDVAEEREAYLGVA